MTKTSLMSHVTLDHFAFLQEMLKAARAVIFDMDGVLIDSEKHHFEAHRKMLEEFGVRIDLSFYIAHGISTDPSVFYARAFGQERLPEDLINKMTSRKRKIYEELQKEEGIVPIEAAISLVKTWHKARKTLAIASGVHEKEIENNLRILKIDRYFSVIVAGADSGLRSKPFPDIYLKAVELLRFQPEDCIAIEDSGHGATAAIRAGINCLVVPNEYTRSHSFCGAIVLSSFDEIHKLVTSSSSFPSHMR